MTSLSSKEIMELFYTDNTKLQHFKKRGTFLSRPIEPGETVLTIVNGKLETIKTASDNEILLRNIEIGSSAESYIIGSETFLKRYDLTTETYKLDGNVWKKAVAKGEIMAYEYKGEPITFVAPWGEEMICEAGDYIANPVGGDIADIYRIEKDTFAQTYSLINS